MQVIQVLQEVVVLVIGSGFYNTFAICNRGKLYCTGENQNKECGDGPKNLQKLTEVRELSSTNHSHNDSSNDNNNNDDRVADVSGGYCHTLVRTVGGNVITMGCGDDGQRGDGRPGDDENDNDDHDHRGVISKIELPKNVKAEAVAAGANHSVVLGNNGIAYTFGANNVGQCGVRNDKKRSATTNTETAFGNHNNNDGDNDNDYDEENSAILSPTPILLPGANKEKVVEISAGYAHTVLRTSSGLTYVFGQNLNGQLGLGHDAAGQNDYQVDPVQVTVNK